MATTGVSVSEWAGRFDTLVAELDDLPFRQVQKACSLGRSKLEAVEVARLAAEITADGDDSVARRKAAAGGRRSKTSANKQAKRAKAVAKNSKLGDKLASGELTDEKLDTIADTMDHDESAATDDDFIDAVAGASVDQGKKLAKERKHRREDGEKEHKRQRRLRKVSKYDDRAAGLSVISLSGDDHSIDQAWRTIRLRERFLHDLDGGRDLAAHEHPRTYDQRLFDAAMELLLGQALDLDGKPIHDSEHDDQPNGSTAGPSLFGDTAAQANGSATGTSLFGRRDSASDLRPSRDRSLFDDATDGTSRTGDAAARAGTNRSETVAPSSRHTPKSRPGPARPSAVLTIGIDGAAHSVGTGPVDDETARRILAAAGLHVSILDTLTGQPLWWGRARRHATLAQFMALVVRDRGCVLCAADWIGCHAHHRIPWNAPARGETNIDDLALLCTSCHTTLHAQHLTLERLDDGTWKTRPATPNELPTDSHPPPKRRTTERGAAADGRSGNVPKPRPPSGRRVTNRPADDRDDDPY